MSETRKYAFTWNLLGDLDEGRPNLGRHTRVEMYRLMQYCFRDVMEEQHGTEAADQLFLEAGFRAGAAFYDHVIGPQPDLASFVRTLQAALKEYQVGVLRVEEADLVAGRFTLTCAEDLDCSGLPETGYELCTYDEGFFAAVLERFTGRRFTVKEVDCWCTGDRTCRFQAIAVSD